MKTRFFGLVLSATAVVACSSSSSQNSAPDGDGGSNAGAAATDESAPASQPSDVVEPDASGPDGAKLTIAKAAFRNVGRFGDTIRIEVSGGDPEGRTSAVHLRFADDTGESIRTLDTNWDGVSDAAESSLHFDVSALGKTTFDGTVTIPSSFSPTSKARKVFVSLENESGARSTEMETPLLEQALKFANESCDLDKIASRCEPGLACKGMPAVCQAGSAPVMSKVAYFGGSTPRMVLRGEDADEDIASITIGFLDGASHPKDVVLTGEAQDGTTASSISIDARESAFGTTFFVEAWPASSFVSQVPKIVATAVDVIGRSSAPVTSTLTSVSVRSFGQACDADGFDACATNAVCFPGLRSGANTCKSASSARADKCSSSPRLDPSKGATRAYGTVAGASLWDAPSGCVPNDAVGRPEAAIPLHLAAAAPSLTITTALPETNFDTAVYLMPSCAPSSSSALGCNDDALGYSSTLTLENVAAGDYTIIVESVQMRGGRFGVLVTSGR